MPTAVIIGASSGLGAACLGALGERRWRVVGAARRDGVIVNLIRELGIDGLAVAYDLRDRAAPARLKLHLMSHAPHIDAIVYCAGINKYAPIGELSDLDWDEAFDVNVRGAFVTVRELLPLLKDGGRIVLTSSTAALAPFEDGTVYCASKTAIQGFALALRDELRARAIGVTIFNPGSMPTGFWGAERSDADRLIPLGFAAGLLATVLEAPANVEVSQLTCRPLDE